MRRELDHDDYHCFPIANNRECVCTTLSPLEVLVQYHHSGGTGRLLVSKSVRCCIWPDSRHYFFQRVSRRMSHAV